MDDASRAAVAVRTRFRGDFYRRLRHGRGDREVRPVWVALTLRLKTLQCVR